MSLFPCLSQFKHKGRIVTTETKFQSRKGNQFMLTDDMTEDEKGIQAIIDLQAVAGIIETKANATKEWTEKFSDYDKDQTMRAHTQICGGTFKKN